MPSDEDSWTEVKRPQTRHKTSGWGGGKSSGFSGYPQSRSAKSSRSTASSRREQDEAARKIFVQGMTLSTKDWTLRKAFLPFGDLSEARIARDQENQSKGFGFVTFEELGAAERAVREGAVRIDGKLCTVRQYSADMGKGSGKATSSGLNEKGLTSEEQSSIDFFVRAHELPPHCREAFMRAGGRNALRVIHVLQSYRSQVSEKVVLAELGKIARHCLSRSDEVGIQEFVRSCNSLSVEEQSRLEALLLSQRPEEFEHILSIGYTSWFQRELSQKVDPCRWVISQINRFRKQQNAEDVQVFCERFGFDYYVVQRLMELSVHVCRRLMQRWQPAGSGSQRERQEEFVYHLEEAVLERREFLKQRERSAMGNVANHEKIMEEWSDDDDDDAANTNAWSSWNTSAVKATSSSGSQHRDFEAFDASLQDGGRERYVIHSGTADANSRVVPTTGTSGAGRRRWVPKPTHFIFCVDTSGSMIIEDCQGPDGYVTRLQAVKKVCHDIITVMALNGQDVFSFVTFNSKATLHFACQSAFNAVDSLDRLQTQANDQTMFSAGIKGIQAAMNRDESKLPAHAIFLSDGEPTDTETYLDPLHKLLKARKKTELRVYTVGFGNPIKTKAEENEFAYLQQLASLGRGHFQHCSTSVESLQGAFTALTSTISRTRDSHSRRSRSTGEQASIASTTPATATAAPLVQSATSSTSGSASASNWLSGAGVSVSKPEGMERIEGMEPIEEDEDSIGSSLETFEDNDAQESKRDPGKSVVFELPQVKHIFKDPHNPTNWETFMAARTSFAFDGNACLKTAAVERVYLRKKPFIQGGMRLVYGMLSESGVATAQNPDSMMCAKRRFADLKKDSKSSFSAHSDFCRCTAVAQFYSSQFRKEIQKIDKSVGKFGFLDCQLFSPLDQGEKGYHFCGEKYISGNYVKLNSNAGYVNQAEYQEHSQVAQAFSHFTFDRSRATLMVVDLQGVCGRDKDNKIYFVLTDPQVHSRGKHDKFGPGDFQDEGIRMFFHKHQCGELCRKLNLKKEYELCQPNLLVPMPCIKDCISFLLGPQRQAVRDIQHKFKASSITVPSEPNGDWKNIQVWADKRGVARIRERLEQLLEQFYKMARYQVPVEGHISWDIPRWLAKQEDWKREHGVSIFLFPPDWQESKVVQEIWVFSVWHGLEKGYEHQDSDQATRKIKADLQKCYAGTDSSSTTVSSGTALEELPNSAGVEEMSVSPTGRHDQESDWGVTQPGPSERWKKYSERGKRYWFREADGKWFWEDNREWTRYQDESGQHWWYHDVSGDWFYEPAN